MTICRACARTVGRSLIAPRALSSHGRILVGASVSPQQRNTSTTSAVSTTPLQQQVVRNIQGAPEVPAKTAPDEQASAGTKHLDYVVRKHLQFLGDDRFKIARHVLSTLNRDAFDEALHLVRKVSKNGEQHMVAWNHLISHLLDKQRLHAAIKLYNEAKKRGQMPNAQTYTIIFEGCANSDHPKLAIGEAVKLYNSLLHSQRIKPNVKHLNAVLKVCSRAGDLEAMFSILHSAEGDQRPNNLTYTTILNALRVRSKPSSRHPELVGLDGEERGKVDHEAVKLSIQRAWGIWQEVVEKWRSGRLVMDEALVCAMGRILKTGDHKDNDSILSLIEQTMNIPRPAGSSSSPRLPGDVASEHGIAAVTNLVERRTRAGMGYATPGRNSLSMVLEALGTTKETSLATRYWDMFVEEYGVQPDSENWFRLFRTLCRGRASSKAADYLARVPPQFVTPAMVHVALQTCVRDNMNDSASEHADRILTHALRTLDALDALTARHYLQAMTGNYHRFKRMADKGDVQGSKAALGKHLVRGMRRLWGPMQKATGDFTPYKTPAGALKGVAAVRYNDARELAATARRMISIADKVINQGMVADAQEAAWVKACRAKMNWYVESVYEGRELREPRMQAKPGRVVSNRSLQDAAAAELSFWGNNGD